jgi:RNA polymerase-associated protein RTF1
VEGIPLPTKPKLSNKINDINALVNRSWTEAELQEKLNRSGALKNKYIPIERTRLNNLIKEAKSAGDEERVEQLRAELHALEGPTLAFNTSLRTTPKKPTGPVEMSQQEKLAILNKENRRKNVEEVRHAQIKERRQAMATQAALARGEVVEEDHSRRHKTIAKFKHDVSQVGKKLDSDRSGTNTPANGTPSLTPKKDVAPLPHIAKLQQSQTDKKGIPTFRRPLTDDDIIGSIDLGIEIEL